MFKNAFSIFNYSCFFLFCSVSQLISYKRKQIVYYSCTFILLFIITLLCVLTTAKIIFDTKKFGSTSLSAKLRKSIIA